LLQVLPEAGRAFYAFGFQCQHVFEIIFSKVSLKTASDKAFAFSYQVVFLTFLSKRMRIVGI
ncbi:hypothetical protein, partial [Alteromonas ponticola]|uniref:hypothetical protein n=1 Tax=Alteromonas ponticola TaxID=2720613 RepID=UPI001B7D137E